VDNFYFNVPTVPVIEEPPESSSIASIIVRGVHQRLKDKYTKNEIKEYVEQAHTDTHKELGRASFIYFAKYYLKNHLYNAFAPAHYELAKRIQNQDPINQKILWIFPREHAKSTIITFAYTLWCILYQKRHNIVIFSDSEKQAKEFLSNIKTELTINVKILRDFGLMRGASNKKDSFTNCKWDERHIITSNGIQVQARSPGSHVRGMNFNQIIEVIDEETGQLTKQAKITRPDLFILDDVLNDKHISNRDVRDKLEKWFFGPLINALDSNRGQIIVVGTLLHKDDLLSRMFKDEERINPLNNWMKFKTPACVINDAGEFVDVLWPGRWSKQKLLHRRREIGSLAFTKEFLLDTREEESQFFQALWFGYYFDQTITPKLAAELNQQGRTIRGLPNDLLLTTAIDPNISSKDGADYTVILTLGFSPSTRNYYVIECYRGRPSPEFQPKEMLRQAMRHGKQFQTGGAIGTGVHIAFVVETIAYQASISYWLRKFAAEKNMWPCRVLQRHENIDKDLRVASMSPMAEQGRLYFPLHLHDDMLLKTKRVERKYQWLEDELDDYPQGTYKDGADALQRAFSGLVPEERKYVANGYYGIAAKEGFEEYVKSHGFVEDYYKNAA